MMRALAAGAAALLLAGCQAKEEPPPPIRPVLYTLAKPLDRVTFGPFSGTVEPRYQSQLGFRIGGRVVARDVTVGDVVKKGQRLAALDPIVTRFALTRAEADVADARAQSENASATETRTRKLIEGSNVTQAQLDQAVANRDTALARLAQAQSSLQKARDQIGYTELHADFDGVVTERRAEVGQDLSAGQTVVTVARPEVREAVVDIPEGLIGAMPRDGRFTVSLQSAPEITAIGTVREIAPFADERTRTRRIRMTLADPPSAFRLGATITVSLSQPIETRFPLPATAILDADGRRFVWIVDGEGKSVARREVALAEAEGPDRVAVRSGLKTGERVVVAGVHSLSEGQAVRLSDEPLP
ncbi:MULTISPECIES: efflux RND transporter periplasmic adaptor subunit [Methylobacterium]|uniref:Efflux pump periplasmic linker BepF n=1 Tax=Methylobacterium jeotgali TaxID=381630 RepID=A0ABQ4SSY6_9HYPH|nr:MULTISPECIES: efflux RND transporter periplasmic adaptor subunit [Methylobacterium]PIU04596.1 MAG: efflux transporter periplasmic adaptor subunit [Methylobacterium sp. CG09_land_8_20_14_0_10_71_15]PIU15967.1 MAG: efflux transporter periplasmic adaptor subunit [Methylobacterium sp. CG08_land_8_20_14_0_20_71_15]GBU17727.1 RND transporter [Methylobacterium sp.]GJE04884.1 Efflux pump periplasmic linker BepF [Methylobacterium jeotgali]